jgi:hypothetical protein
MTREMVSLPELFIDIGCPLRKIVFSMPEAILFKPWSDHCRVESEAFAQPNQLTPYWVPLAPTNEQLFDEARDPWFVWVRQALRGRSSVDSGKPATDRQLKTGHHERAAETSEFYFVPFSVRKSVCSFVRQLRGPHLSTCA